MTLKKNKQINTHIRLFKIVFLHAKQSLLVCLLGALLAILVPYLTIFLSSSMVSSLEAGAFKPALFFLSAFSVTNLMNGCIQAFLTRRGKEQDTRLALGVEESVNCICRNVGFETLESSAFQDACQRARDGLNYSDGFYEYLMCLQRVIVNFAKISLSVGFILALMLRHNSWDSNRYIVLLLSLLCMFSLARIRLNKLAYRSSSKFYSRLAPYNRQLQYFFTELLGDERYSREIHLYRLKDLISGREEQCHQSILVFLKGIAKNTAKFSIISEILQGVLSGAIYLCVTLKCVTDHLGIGGILKYIGIVHQFSDSLSALLNGVLDLRFKTGFLENYLNFADQFTKEMAGETARAAAEETARGTARAAAGETVRETAGEAHRKESPGKNASIRLENVSYSFPDAGNCGFSLKNICLEVEAGSKVAIVGENGSGKTTLIKVMTGLYPVSSGKIYLDGEEVCTDCPDRSITVFSAIFQDYNIFPVSLLENVTFDRGEEKEALSKAQTCIAQMGLSSRVAGMKDGMHTILKWNSQDGSAVQKMSGGEEQKLALARALYRDAPIFILDEPSASMDPRAEEKLFRDFYRLTGEKTTIFISHRLSSCRICDKVIVVDNGEIVQTGRHDELCRIPGKYKQMWDVQASQYQ